MSLRCPAAATRASGSSSDRSSSQRPRRVVLAQAECLQQVLARHHEIEPGLFPAVAEQHDVHVPAFLAARTVAAVKDRERLLVTSAFPRQPLRLDQPDREHVADVLRRWLALRQWEHEDVVVRNQVAADADKFATTAGG